ncbi:MAG: RNA polymerase sigma factor SigZ [Anaerolineae bacterium]|nr:RNA polymerase sigma factor SigZ [Anaerolineae bacterium]
MDTPNLETLYITMHDRLCLFICSRTAYAADAEDILQDVFLRIHTHLGSVREVEKLESWIYQVARNSIIDYYRRGRRLVELKNDLPAELEEENEPDPGLAPYLRQLVESLPEPYRQAIQLTDYEGLSQKEMAGRLGISISGAKSRVQRARLKIKEMMLLCCHYEFDKRGAILEYRERCCCCDDNQPCR